MEVEEPTFVYHSQPTIARLRGQIIKSVKHEEDIHALRYLWLTIVQMKKAEEPSKSPKSLATLRGILKTGKTSKTYKEMRNEHMLRKYGL